MNVLHRNNVDVTGNRPRTMMFAYGFGCDQAVWDAVVPAFEADYPISRFDHVSAGGSDVAAYETAWYDNLNAYARDVLEIIAALDLTDLTFVGHSVGAMIGMLAVIEEPDRFAALVMICPSSRYVDEPGYKGGFSRADRDELLEMVDNFSAGRARRRRRSWGTPIAPNLAGNWGTAFAGPIRPSRASSLG